MAGFFFVVCVPTSEHESAMIENSRRKSVSSNTTNDDYFNQIPIKPEMSKNFIKKSSSADSLSEKYISDNVTHISIDSKTSKEDINDGLDNNVNKHKRNSLNSSQTGLNDVQTGIYNVNYQDTRPESYHSGIASARVRSQEELSKGNVKIKMHSQERMLSMSKVLEKVLKKLKIENAVWSNEESGQYFQVLFSVGCGDSCEEILRHFSENGIGVKLNSVVSVIPCTLYYHGKDQQSLIEDSPSVEQVNECGRKNSTKLSAWDKFVLSVRARLTVAQVVEGVKADANLTFDFLAQLLISSFVAALGLVENSTVILVASMIISPLMGPIMAGTFGTVIGDRQLLKIGVLNELFGLFVCLLVGFFFGLAAGLANEHWGNAGWPTDEMISRGQIRSLWVGVLIALASGGAVAIAILGDHTGSLVGVAISASLMPPAVNAGLLWALACMDQLWQGRMKLEDDDGSGDAEKMYNPIYSRSPPIELAILGAISLCLTLVNIICIFFAGILVFKIKEVAPRTSKGNHQQFWSHDIKIARDYNKTFHNEDAEELQKRMAEEIAVTKLQTNGYNVLKNMSNQNLFVNVQEMFDHPKMNGFYNQRTWSHSKEFLKERRPTLQELERMYTTRSIRRPRAYIDAQPVPVNQCLFPDLPEHTIVSTVPEECETVSSFETPSTSSSTTSAQQIVEASNLTSIPDQQMSGTRRFTVTLASDPTEIL